MFLVNCITIIIIYVDGIHIELAGNLTLDVDLMRVFKNTVEQ